MEIDYNTRLYGHFVWYDMKLESIHKYVRLVDVFIEKDVDERRLTEIGIDEPPIDEYRTTFRSLLFNSMLIMATSLIEDCFVDLSKILSEIYDIRLSINDLRGNIFNKFRKFLMLIVEMRGFVKSYNWSQIEPIYILRNYIIHNNSHLPDDWEKNQKSLLEFINRHDMDIIHDYTIEMDRLVLTKIFKLIEDFFEALFRYLLNTHSGDYKI